MATAPDTQQPQAGKNKKTKKSRSASLLDPAVSNNAANVGAGAMGGVPTPTRQLEFHQAMSDFQKMFPSMDTNVIETILRSNNGAVDATIDQLLALAADMPTETQPRPPQQPQLPRYGDPLDTGFSSPPQGTTPVTPVMGNNLQMGISDQPPPYSPPMHNSPFAQDMRSRQLPDQPVPQLPPLMATPPLPVLSPAPPITPSPAPSTPSSAPPTLSQLTRRPPPTRPAVTAVAVADVGTPPRARHARWNPPLLGDLPDDFLRVMGPNDQRQSMVSADLQQRMELNSRKRSSIGVNDIEMQQLLEDERFALTLQNEEFMKQLQLNPEFTAALDRDYSQAVDQADASLTPAMSSSSVPTDSQIETSQEPASTLAATGATGGVSADDVEFINKLTHMGKTTRYKFTQMAKKFNKMKRRSSKPQLDEESGSSMMGLLDDCNDQADLELLGTRPDVADNLYSDHQMTKTHYRKKGRPVSEPNIFH